MILPTTPIGKIIYNETNGRGYGVYDPERCHMTVYFNGSTDEQRRVLMLKLRDYIDRRGLWNSFETITIQNTYTT